MIFPRRTAESASAGATGSPRTQEPSGQERALLARAFEEPSSIFRLLSTLRTRRVGLGYAIETGEEETFTWSSNRTFTQPRGPLAHRPETEPIPLSEVEEALLCWAGLGPNGTVLADIAVHGALSGLLSTTGRTIPSSSNDCATDLFVVNDSGVSLYRPVSERHAPVEIAGPEDYPRVLAFYRDGLTPLSSTRPDVGWFSAPEGTQNVNPMGPGQYNLNRPGSTWLLPVVDIGLEWFNQLLASYEWSGFYLMDPASGDPLGCKEWICPGFLEVGFPLPAFDELVLLLGASQAACAVQNIRLAAEALGVGAWPVGSYADDLILGAYPEIAAGLGFSFLSRDDDRNPSKTVTCLGLPGIKEAVVVPSPRFPDAASAVRYVKELRYAGGSPLSPISGDSPSPAGPFRPEIAQELAEHPRSQISDWAEEAAIATVERIVALYGACPAFVSPIRAKFSVQLHHVDQSFYRAFHVGSPQPYAITPTIADHFATWHPGVPDPSAGSPLHGGTDRLLEEKSVP